jgi:hypothetical protein
MAGLLPTAATCTRTLIQPNRISVKQERNDRFDNQQHNRELLMMGIVMAEMF